MLTRTRASFEFYQLQVDPDEITEAIGLQPTRIWRKGEDTMPWLKRGKEYKGARYNHWALSSGEDVSKDVESHIVALVDKLRPFKAQIKSLASSHEARIWVSAHYYDDTSNGIYLNSELLQAVADLGIAIDYEFWCPNMSEQEAQEYIAKTRDTFAL